MGQTQDIKEAVWLKSLLDQLNPENSTSFLTENSSSYALNATIIYYDNQTAIALAKNLKSYARSKHIDIQ